MSDHRKKGGDGNAEIGECWTCSGRFCNRYCSEHGSQTFGEVDNEDRIAEALAQDSGDVCRAHVSAADLPDINASKFACDASCREGSEQIGDQSNGSDGEDHEFNYADPAAETLYYYLSRIGRAR